MSSAATLEPDDDRREWLTRSVLTSPIEQSNGVIAERLGVSRETVRKIRDGRLHAKLCPDLDRLEPPGRAGCGRTCTQCEHWISNRYRVIDPEGHDIRRLGICGLGIPEAENVRFARGCGAFTEARVKA